MNGADSGTGGGILSYFTRHKTAANLLMGLMVLAGLVAVPNMRAQYFPDVVSEVLTVSVAWPNAGAGDVDAGIVQVLEPALLLVAGVTGSAATAYEGRARISLEFGPGQDMARAEREVQAALDGARALPDAAEDPEIRRGGFSDRVTDLVITGPVGAAQLGRFADEMVTRLFARGVTQTTVQGVAAGLTVVEVPSLALIRHDIGMEEIAAAIGREVTAEPAGDVSGTARVRTGSAKRAADQIAGIVLRQTADGASLTVGDVGRVRAEPVDRERAFFVGDDPAVQIRVDRSAGGDAIGLQAAVAEVAREMQAGLPAGVRIELFNSTAGQISGRLSLLLDNAVMGLVLVLGLLVLFLNTRTAIWVAAGIPVALLSGVALMYMGGLTINMISLFALIMTLGIVVDDAIVVGEHADYRLRVLGETPVEAAERAARKMFWPVVSATVTTNIAFFGLIAIGGRFGGLIADIPFTVIAVLSMSLLECFVILPHHLSHSLGGARDPWYDWPSRVMNRGVEWFLRVMVRPVTGWVIMARYPVLALAVVLLASQVALFLRGDVQWRFFSSPEQSTVSGNFAMLPGATRSDTMAMMREMQRAVAAMGVQYLAENGVDPVRFVIASVGGNAGRGLAGAETKESWQLGSISIELVDADQRPFSSSEFVTALQAQVVQHPMTETLAFRSFGAGPGGDAIDVQFSAASPEVLKAAAEALKARLRQFPEVSALEDSLAYDKDELILQLTPQGQALGLTIDALGGVLRDRLNGIKAAAYPDGTREATVQVELPEADLTADFLDRTLIRTALGAYLPLADIVTVTRRPGFSTVQRENGVAVISVSGAVADDDPARATAISRALEAEILPKIAQDYRVDYQVAGLDEAEDEFLSGALQGLILCLTGIYLVLAWIFGSWTRPVVVMAVIPFGLVGAIWGHYHWDIPMSMFSVVGMIGMVGIIINDAIVLVTTIDEYRADRGLRAAIVDGVADRLKPVFLTTATTVLGLAPLLYEGSNQAEFLKPTVVTLVYGLGFGMLLVLMVVPALMAVQHDIGGQLAAFWSGLREGRAVRAGALAALGLFAALILPVLVTGGGWPWLLGLMPGLGSGLGSGFWTGFALFALGLAAVLLVIFVAAGWRRRSVA